MRRIGEQAFTFRLPAVVGGEMTYIDPGELSGQWVVLSFVPGLGSPTGFSVMSKEWTWKSLARRCSWFRWRRRRSTKNNILVAEECISQLWEIHWGGYSVSMVIQSPTHRGGLEHF